MDECSHAYFYVNNVLFDKYSQGCIGPGHSGKGDMPLYLILHLLISLHEIV